MSWNNKSKSDEPTFLVAEDLSQYLVGSDEDMPLITKQPSIWDEINKNFGWNNKSKSDEPTFLVAEDLSQYLVGSDEDMPLITKQPSIWDEINKNIATYSNLTKN